MTWVRSLLSKRLRASCHACLHSFGSHQLCCSATVLVSTVLFCIRFISIFLGGGLGVIEVGMMEVVFLVQQLLDVFTVLIKTVFVLSS